MEQHQTALDKSLEDNGGPDLRIRGADAKSNFIQKGEDKIAQAESELTQGKNTRASSESAGPAKTATQAALSSLLLSSGQSQQQIQDAESQLNQKADLAKAEKDLSAKNKLVDAKADLNV